MDISHAIIIASAFVLRLCCDFGTVTLVLVIREQNVYAPKHTHFKKFTHKLNNFLSKMINDVPLSDYSIRRNCIHCFSPGPSVSHYRAECLFRLSLMLILCWSCPNILPETSVIIFTKLCLMFSTCSDSEYECLI